MCGGSSACRRAMASALTVSLVWLDSMSATSVWKRRSRALASGRASRSHPIVSTAALAAAPRSRISLTTAYTSSQSDGGSTVASPVAASIVLRAGLRARPRGLRVVSASASPASPVSVSVLISAVVVLLFVVAAARRGDD